MFLVLKVIMKKDKLYIFGSLALFAWISMTYFLFVHKPNSLEGRGAGGSSRTLELDSLKTRLSNFEERLKENLDYNSAFLKQLQDILVSKTPNVKPKVVNAIKDKSSPSPPGDSSTPKIVTNNTTTVIPVLMFACNRVTIRKSLDLLLGIRKDPKKFPIIVSQVPTHI